MQSVSETGHAKNIANFQDLIEFIVGYGVIYNPANESIQLRPLMALKSDADTILADVITKKTEFSRKVNERINAFEGLNVLSTRLINALKASGADTETIKDARGFVRKLQGKRASSAKKEDSGSTAKISVSQLSYDQQIQHFSGLIAVLNAEPVYHPNEAELKYETLLGLQTNLAAINTAVAKAYADVQRSRIKRNHILYGDNGLVRAALETKAYIKSVFGTSSPQYSQVKGIEFKSIQ